MKINELFGEAYNNAINNVINHLNALGWNWDYFNNWRDAHEFAEMHGVEFDINGNFAN
jgi:hypothetical protein